MTQQTIDRIYENLTIANISVKDEFLDISKVRQSLKELTHLVSTLVVNYEIEKSSFVVIKKISGVKDICDGCGGDLPDPVSEDRGSGNFELVTYCKCGRAYYE